MKRRREEGSCWLHSLLVSELLSSQDAVRDWVRSTHQIGNMYPAR